MVVLFSNWFPSNEEIDDIDIATIKATRGFKTTENPIVMK